MPDSLRDRLRNRGEQIDETVENAQRGNGERSDPKPKAKPKPKERSGTGTPSFDLDGAIAKLRAKIAATDDPTLKAKLKARIEALKANQ